MSVLSAIGNTPIVEFTNLDGKRSGVRILGKLEGANPGGSVKDRPAYFMIQRAELVGMSSGAAVAGALRIAKTMARGTIVALLPDRGDRYLSRTLFRSICAKCPP